MTAHVLPFGPTQAAEFVDKREATAKARCCLAGIALKSIRLPDGQTVYAAGLLKFASIDQLEDWLDRLVELE